MALIEEKAALRTQMRAARKAIDPMSRKTAEDDLCERLFNLPAIKKAKVIGVYSAAGSEVSINDLVKAIRLVDSTCIVAYPAIRGEGIMHFAAVAKDEVPFFVADPLAIVELSDLAGRLVEPASIDVLLVPGVAFDEERFRLGQGGGYYDRYLEALKDDCLTIGIAFDEQIIEAVPHGVHDRKVNYVVTPTRIIS